MEQQGEPVQRGQPSAPGVICWRRSSRRFERGGLKLGFYYSPASWSHPDYPGAYFRDWPTESDWRDEAARKRFIAYYQAELHELLTGYGQVDYLWYDGCIPNNLDGTKTNEMLRKLQPEMLITERNGPPFDIHVSEQAIKPAAPGQPWESCLTLNENWGYHAGDSNYKSSRQVIELLLTTAASGGNLLLNVGPRADGTVPDESAKILREVGQWLKRNHGFLAESDRNPFSWNNTAKVTVKGNRVYLHFLADPHGNFCLAEIKNQVRGVSYLAGGQPIDFQQKGDYLYLRNLPSPLPDHPITTIEIEVDGKPEPIRAQSHLLDSRITINPANRPISARSRSGLLTKSRRRS